MKKNLCVITEIWNINRTIRNIYCVCAALVLLFAFVLIAYQVFRAHKQAQPIKISMMVPAPYEPDEDDEVDEWPYPQYAEALPLPTEAQITGIDLMLVQEWPKVPSDKVKKRKH